MPRDDYKTCKECLGHADDVGPLSHKRLCGDCGVKLAKAAAISLADHSGPYFKRWREGMVASVGGILLDDLATRL